jgi:hypothetical protein
MIREFHQEEEMKGLRFLLLSIFFMTIIISAQAAVINVPTDYPTIQQGIDAAQNGDTVIVADGVYTGIGNKDLDFRGKSITVKSANGPASTIIDCGGLGRGVYFHSGETTESVLSGFTIKNASPTADLIKIALNAQTGEKLVSVNADIDSARPDNDDDPAIEPGELMRLDITLRNSSPSSLQNVRAILKSDDPRIIGMKPIYVGNTLTGWDRVDMSTVGITVDYGSISGNSTKASSYQFVEINEDFTPLGDQVPFELQIQSGSTFVGSDDFNVKVGSDIVLDRVDVDSDLKPGSDPEDIDVRFENITALDIEDIRIAIDPNTNDIDIDDDRVDIDEIRAGRTAEATFRTTIDEDFSGYATFTLTVEVNRRLINIESFRHYFGRRTKYATHWIEDDDDGNPNDIAEPGEDIEFQIALWNPTDMKAEDVEVELDSDDPAVDISESDGDYNDIPPYEVVESDDEFRFVAEDIGSGLYNQLRGREVEFTLTIIEDGEEVGTETFRMRIGGTIRYLPPQGFNDLMSVLNDDEDLGPNNNGNGYPEPGEIIEMEVELANIITDDAGFLDEDVEDVEAELDSDDDVDIIVDDIDYGDIDEGRKETETYVFRIDDDFEGNKITFELSIRGRIDDNREDLGVDVFTIPVWKNLEEDSLEMRSTDDIALNKPTVNGSPAEGYGGAILCANSSSPTIQNNIIIDNVSTLSGGGIYCVDNSSPVIANNLIIKNNASQYGGGVGVSGNSFPKLINNTISGNTAGLGGGGLSCRGSSFPTVLNSILWDDIQNEIFVEFSSGANVTYSDVKGGWLGTGNINVNPQFLNAANNDYHLKDNSPCIAAGLMTQDVPVTDIEGNPRPNASGTKPDMGAYENFLPVVSPTVASVSPSAGIQGATNLSVEVNGTSFNQGTTVSFSGSGITVKSVNFVSSTELTARIDIALSASIGSRDVIVTNPDNRAGIGQNLFTVTAADAVVVKAETVESVSKGESFVVSVNVEDVTDLAGFQLSLSFDSNALEAMEVNEGTFLSKDGETFWLEPVIDNNAGTITGIVSARASQGGANGSGTLATITFKALDIGETRVNLTEVILSDSGNQSIPIAPRDAIIDVTEHPPWDVNKDGRVDVFDFVIVGQHFGEEIPVPIAPNPDVNRDGVVDIFDLVLIGQHFGEVYTPSAPTTSLWSSDPAHLPVLIEMYDAMKANPSSDPEYIKTRSLLQKLITNAKVSNTEVFQNFPNPFNPETWIPFQLSEASAVEISIYDSAGQLVRVLDLGYRDAGRYTFQENSARWDGTNQSGEKVASGVYFYTIRAGEYTSTRKMLLLK